MAASSVNLNSDCERSKAAKDLPFLGVGLGFRDELAKDILANVEEVDFLELMPEHFVDRPTSRLQLARRLAEQFHIVVHGLDLSIGTIAPLKREYLEKMRDLADLTEAHWVSDHLCLTGIPGRAIGNLTPVPLNHSTCTVLMQKCREAVESFEVPFLLENISVLFRPEPTEIGEGEFMRRVLEAGNAYLLLDLTNVYNNATNGNIDPRAYLESMPLDRVIQIHLAGGLCVEGIVLDTHSAPVPDEVFELLAEICPRMPNLRGVMIERDQDFSSFEELVSELRRIKDVLRVEWASCFGDQVEAAPSWL